MPIIDTCWPKAEAAVVKPDQIQPNQANINKNDGGQGMLEREGEEGERERRKMVVKMGEGEGKGTKGMMDYIIVLSTVHVLNSFNSHDNPMK